MSQQVLVKDIYEWLCHFAPPSLAEDWDNVGLQVGRRSERVRGILVALDVTESVLREAERLGANLLITHHPLFFRGVNRLDDSMPPMRLARAAVEKKINILSFHTNLDATQEGLNDLLAARLKLKGIKPLVPARDPKLKRAGLGRVGKVPKTTLKKFVVQVGRSLDLAHSRYVGRETHPIQTVAVMTGSGAGYYAEAKKAGAHVLVTGDVKYHTALDALSEGIALIDVGHFAGEIGMVSLIVEKLRQWIKGKKISLSVHGTKAQEDPFHFFPGE